MAEGEDLDLSCEAAVVTNPNSRTTAVQVNSGVETDVVPTHNGPVENTTCGDTAAFSEVNGAMGFCKEVGVRG